MTMKFSLRWEGPMSSSDRERATPDLVGSRDDLSDYQAYLLDGRLNVHASHSSVKPNYGDELWRWQFPVCDATGVTRRYVRVNAATEESAIALAAEKIDADRTLGKAVRVRRATET